MGMKRSFIACEFLGQRTLGFLDISQDGRHVCVRMASTLAAHFFPCVVDKHGASSMESSFLAGDGCYYLVHSCLEMCPMAACVMTHHKGPRMGGMRCANFGE